MACLPSCQCQWNLKMPLLGENQAKGNNFLICFGYIRLRIQTGENNWILMTYIFKMNYPTTGKDL